MLVDAYSQPIYWHIRRLVVNHDDAQDTVQETFIKVFRNINDLKDENSLKSWIYRIATNEALRFLQRNTPESTSIDEAGTDLFALKADEYTDYSDLEAVKLQQAIATLPEKQKVTFTLRYYDELPYEDIAAITDTSVASAKVNYHIAKNKVINYISDHD